jgi:hypothetical protein
MRALRSAYAIAALLAALYLLLSTVPELDAAAHTVPGDGVIDWLGARAFWEHVNPFSAAGLARYGITAYGFGHPPTTPFWFLPLTRWHIEMMGIVVAYVTMFMLLLHAVIIAYELDCPAPPATAALLFTAVLSTSWFRDHLRMAQLSEAIALFYVLAWYCLRQKRDVAGGAMLGLATTLKLFPGLMVLFLLLSRRWAAFVAACVSWLVVATIMTWRYGIVCWPQFFALQGAIANQWVANIRNSSLHGIVLRLFWPVCVHGGPVLPASSAIAITLTLLLLAGAWWLSRPALAERIDLPFALFALLSFFVNPWSWEHYNVLVVLPFMLALTTLLRGAGRTLPLAIVLVGMALLAAIVWMLDLDIALKRQLLAQYHDRPSSALHVRLHLYEVFNWLPQVLLMAILTTLLWWQERQRR